MFLSHFSTFMGKFLFTITLLSSTFLSFAQNDKDIQAIRAVLSTQQNAWNNGNLEAFMDGYWRSDSLSFIGKRGINYGWQKTLDNYKKSYPDKAAMGTLHFDILKWYFLLLVFAEFLNCKMFF